jgi:hypothetical protein
MTTYDMHDGMNLLRTCVLTYGLWEQVRVDCGSEFLLSLYIQEKMRQMYVSCEIVPFVQTPSTQVCLM